MAHSIRREGFLYDNRRQNLGNQSDRRKESMLDSNLERKRSMFDINEANRQSIINPEQKNRNSMNYDNFSCKRPNTNGNTVYSSGEVMTGFGNTKMFSNGSSQTKLGSTYFEKDNVTTKVGDSLFSKNGVMTKMNNTYVTPNGIYTKVGNSLIGPDGHVWSNIKNESEIDSILIHKTKKQEDDE